MKRLLEYSPCLLVVLLLLLWSAPASAESDRNWTAHAGFGFYSLDFIDDEFSGISPARDIFGDKKQIGRAHV